MKQIFWVLVQFTTVQCHLPPCELHTCSIKSFTAFENYFLYNSFVLRSCIKKTSVHPTVIWFCHNSCILYILFAIYHTSKQLDWSGDLFLYKYSLFVIPDCHLFPPVSVWQLYFYA